MRLGVHVPIAGGVLESVKRAERLGCNTMQIFSRSPRGGRAPVLSPDTMDAFQRGLRALDIRPLAVHAPYIINLASPDSRMWEQSLALYREEYRRATQLGADYLVTHVGSDRGAGAEAGMAQVTAALDAVLAGDASPVVILLENTAGAGQGLGSRFEQLAQMRRHAAAPDRIAYCLDTAHLFASGYPIHEPDGLDRVIDEFDRIAGWEQVRLVHLNDSKVPFNAKSDRHWHIGEGHIGAEAFRRFVNHPAITSLPLILETPKDSDKDDPRNLARVRTMRQASAPSAPGEARR